MNTHSDATDSKWLPNDVFETVKHVTTNPNAEYYGIDLSKKGTILSLIEKYDDANSDDTATLTSDERCFSVSEDISPTLPEQSQWN